MGDEAGREHIAIRALRERIARLDEARRMNIREFNEIMAQAREKRIAAEHLAKSISVIEAAIIILKKEEVK